MTKIYQQNWHSTARQGAVREVKMVSGATGYQASRFFLGEFQSKTFHGSDNSEANALAWAGLEEVVEAPAVIVDNRISLERAQSLIALENPKAVWEVAYSYADQPAYYRILDNTYSPDVKVVIATYDVSNSVLSDSHGCEYDLAREARKVRVVLMNYFSSPSDLARARAHAETYGIDISGVKQEDSQEEPDDYNPEDDQPDFPQFLNRARITSEF